APREQSVHVFLEPVDLAAQRSSREPRRRGNCGEQQQYDCSQTQHEIGTEEIHWNAGLLVVVMTPLGAVPLAPAAASRLRRHIIEATRRSLQAKIPQRGAGGRLDLTIILDSPPCPACINSATLPALFRVHPPSLNKR